MSIPSPTPVKTVVDTKHGDDNITKTHPSYVMVGLSRITSSPPGIRLFGSELHNQTFIRLSVVEAEESWHLSQKWHHGAKQLIQVDLSPAQFAELLTSMNVGSGVTGTLRFLKGDGHIPSAIDEDTLPEQIKADLKHDSQTVIDAAKAFDKELQSILGGSKLTKAERARLLEISTKLQMTLSSSMPFVIDQYQEAIDKVTMSAKAEVDAFMTHAALKIGMKSLADVAKVLALTDGTPIS